MEDRFSRTKLLIGEDKLNILKDKCVLIFGLGGVGGYVLEALARSGVGNFILVDNDVVSISNINRQILALTSTIGKKKTEVAKAHILDINPSINVEVKDLFYLPNEENDIDFEKCDYVVDAIDTISAKIDIVKKCTELGIPVISSMGAGNKVSAKNIIITDIFKTEYDPVAKVMRYELRKRGIKKLKVCYSKELPIKTIEEIEDKKRVLGSISYVPASFGLMIANEIIKDLIGEK